MTRKSKLSFFVAIFMAFVFMLAPIGRSNVYAGTSQKFYLIILSDYNRTMTIQQQFKLKSLNLTGRKLSYKSSNPSVATVNSKGLVTAKNAGSCRIIAQAGRIQRSCYINVLKTVISLSHQSAIMEKNSSLQLKASSSTHHKIRWKSSRPSIASVDQNGRVTSNKVGFALISASADGVTRYCELTVKAPSVRLAQKQVSLYRTKQCKLTAYVSSGQKPVFKSSNSSIAIVDSNGVVTAIKHGSTVITASVDGVTANCVITVKQPTITINPLSLSMCVNEKFNLKYSVSSGVAPSWSSSNINIVTVDNRGRIIARQPGKAYIYAREDGVKASCIVTVVK